MARGFVVGALVATSVVMVGCAGVAPTRSATGVEALYAQMARAGASYRQAVDGADTDAAAARTQALAQLRRAARRCGQTAGCDMQRFVSLYNELLGGDEDAAVAATNGDDAGDVAVDTAIPAAQRTVTLLHGHKLADLIAVNGPVKAALEEWLTWRRPQLMRSYINYRYLRPLMWPPFDHAGLPEAVLFGIVAKESNGKVHAVSRAGAKGPLQFMPATGRRFGLKVVNGFDERFDPHRAAQAAAAYMEEQLKVFNDNLELVLAAYNGGEGRMRRLVDGHTDKSFYDPSIYFEVPRQTRRYVPLVLAAAWLFMHPERYHLQFPDLDVAPGSVRLARAASLSELSVCLGQDGGMRDGWFRTLRNLNPRLNPQNELPAGTRVHLPRALEAAYARDCTDGPWPILAADLHSGSVPAPPPSGLPRHYVVQRGDTLSGIVRKLGCSSVREIARANHLRRPHYAIRTGQRLTLPRCY